MARILRERLNFGKVTSFMEVPNLIDIQKNSYEQFLQKDVPPDERQDVGLQAAILSIFPITDYNETAAFEFLGYVMKEPKFNVRECLQKGITYSAPLKIKVRLNIYEVEGKNKRLKESREQGGLHRRDTMMTETGTFIVNGTERVIVNQLHRSPGVFSHDKGVRLTQAAGFCILTDNDTDRVFMA